ncbi:MAG TPA: EAL domain-containing protein, partial [Pseudomonadales bacterium]|nr:EAL domain-containing protein [Pseudomonadales bacterium]
SLHDGKHVPVLMMTGSDDIDSIQKSFEAGATDFIMKPINTVVFEQRVRFLLKSNHVLESLRDSQERLANAQRLAKLGNWEWDEENKTFSLSSEARRIFGLTADEPATILKLLNHVHPQDRRRVLRVFRHAIEDKMSLRLEHRIILRDGTERTVQQEGVSTYSRVLKQELYSGMVQDVTERKQARDEILRLAYYDPLTGLPNRTFLRHMLGFALEQAKRKDMKVGILLLDLDLFTRINTSLGHSAGDLLLEKVAKRLQSCLRQSDFIAKNNEVLELEQLFEGRSGDTLARVDSDQFLAFLSEIKTPADVATVARRISHVMAKPFQINNSELVITVSMGISVFPDNGPDIESLIKNADAAMHHAKAQGRNNYQFYSASINAMALERLSIENDLRHAIERDELRLHFQPKVNLHDGEVTEAEALIRWQHPTRGMIPPYQFIGIAEETGMIIPMGHWIIQETCRKILDWRARGLGSIRVAVNLSAAQFKERGLVDFLRETLQQFKLDGSALELEITEGLLMEDTERTISALNAFRDLGVQVALDDFGTGYSSLSYLTRFPINTLKIDRSFVKEVSNNPQSAAIVTAIISLCKSLNLEVVAEGVETRAELSFLRTQSCDVIQGFLFSK